MRVPLTALLIICAAAYVCVAQEQSTAGTGHPGVRDTKIDEYGNIPWKDEKQRLDWLAEVLEGGPEGVIYLNFYDGRRGCAGEARRRALRAKDYLVRVRGVRPEQVVWRWGGHREDLTTEAWVLQPSERAPAVVPTVDPREARPRVCGRKASRRRSKP